MRLDMFRVPAFRVVVFASVCGVLHSDRGEESATVQLQTSGFKVLQHANRTDAEIRLHANASQMEGEKLNSVEAAKESSADSNVSYVRKKSVQHGKMQNPSKADDSAGHLAHLDSEGSLPDACQEDLKAFKAGRSGIFSDYQTERNGQKVPGTGRCNLATCHVPDTDTGKWGPSGCTAAKTAEGAATIIDTCIAQNLVALQNESNKDPPKLKEDRMNTLKGAQGLIKHGCTEQLCTQICKYPPFGSTKPNNGAASRRRLGLLVVVALPFSMLCG